MTLEVYSMPRFDTTSATGAIAIDFELLCTGFSTRPCIEQMVDLSSMSSQLLLLSSISGLLLTVLSHV